MECYQKFAAIQALAPDAALRMRGDGGWYVATVGIEIKKGPMLESPTQNGSTPGNAIGEAWDQLTKLKPDEYLIVRAYQGDRRAFRWNGFMWEDVKERS